jgi:hypothetical protein
MDVVSPEGTRHGVLWSWAPGTLAKAEDAGAYASRCLPASDVKAPACPEV